MLTARRWGGTDTRSSPSSSTRPSSGISRPASSRNSVVLPQPEGPSSAKNSPWKMSSDSPATALVTEKRLVTPSNRTSGGSAGFRQGIDVRGAARRLAGLLLMSALTLVMPDTLAHDPEKLPDFSDDIMRRSKKIRAFSVSGETENVKAARGHRRD